MSPENMSSRSNQGRCWRTPYIVFVLFPSGLYNLLNRFKYDDPSRRDFNFLFKRLEFRVRERSYTRDRSISP